MYSFLDSIGEDSLRQYLQRVSSIRLRNRIPKLSRREIYRSLFALYGFDVLYDKRIRRLLLLSTKQEYLAQLASDAKIDPHRKPYDIAVALSNLPWRQGGHFVWIFAEYFDVPVEYLPSSTQRTEAVELVEPYLPPPAVFEYQEDLINKLLSVLKSEKPQSCLLQLPTGAGKTRTAVEAIVRHLNNSAHKTDAKESVVWLAHTEELCEQAVESFRRVWQVSAKYETRIVRLWGEFNPSTYEMQGAIVVAGYQKIRSLLAKSRQDFQNLKEKTGLIVIDEAHKALAPTMQEVLTAFEAGRSRWLVGLTATPGRGRTQTQENEALAALFGRHLIFTKKLGNEPIKELQRKGILAEIKRAVRPSNLSFALSQEEEEIAKFTNDLPVSFLRRLAQSQERNDLIISIVAEQIRQGNPTLIFACTMDHAKELAMAVAMHGIKAASIDYRMRRGLRSKIVSAFRDGEIDAMFNFGVLSTGFDAPNIRTVVIARPTSSIVLYSQMIGRGLRGKLVGGTEECTLIDIKDNIEAFGDVDQVYSYFDRFWK